MCNVYEILCLSLRFFIELSQLNMLMKLSAVCETKFHYQDKIPPIDYAVNVASNMQVM